MISSVLCTTRVRYWNGKGR